MQDVTHLYEQWHGRVLSFARTIVAPAEAEGVAQDVFLEVWQRMPDYDPARAGIWTWIRAITRSRCLDRLRSSAARQRALRHSSQDASWDTPDESWESSDRIEVLLRGLPPKQRRVVELAYFQGLSHREIALRTADPLGTVKTRLRLALELLRKTAGAPRRVQEARGSVTTSAAGEERSSTQPPCASMRARAR